MNPRLAPLNALRAFEAAARHLSFKDAAAELHVTPTAISHQIRTLEHYLGVRLFQRLPRALSLTPAGEALMPGAREGINSFARAVEKARDAASHTRLTVLCPPLFAVSWLLPRLSAFSSRHPEITLRVARSLAAVEGAGEALPRESASSDGLQTCIVFGPPPAGRSACLFTPAVLPVCAPALMQGPHPLRQPADLVHHTLLHDDSVPPGGEWPRWEEWLEAAGVRETVGLDGPHFSDSSLVIEAALSGLGIGLALSPLVQREVAAGRLVAPFPLALPVRRSYYLLLPAPGTQHAALQAFHDWILAEAARDATTGTALSCFSG